MADSLLNITRQELLEFVGLNETVVRAQGTRIETASGQTLIDFVGQFGAVPFGYGAAPITEAIHTFLASGQASLVQPLINPGAEELARRLIELAPGNHSKVTFTTSGAETVEAAIKLCRAATQRELVIGTLTGFHGKTQGAVAVTGKAIYREPFQIRAEGFSHVPYGDLEALEALLKTRRAAAFFVEAVQGEAGMITPPPGYLLAAQNLCRQYGTLFVLDEIQTGLGRTGELFAATAHGLEPDVVLLAKALGGGVAAIGACIYGEQCWSRDFDRHHSSTFAVNGFSAAIGLAVLDQLTANDGAQLKHAAQQGAYLYAGLSRLVRDYPEVFHSLDGRGLMLGLKFRRWSGERLYTLSLASAFGALVPIVCGYLKSRHGVYCLPTLTEGNVLRIQPPLCIERADIDLLLEGLKAVAELVVHNQQHRLILEAHGYAGPRGVPSPWVVPGKPRSSGRCLGRFAFLLHPTTAESVNGDSVVDGLGLSAAEKTFMQGWLDDFSEWAKPDLDAGVSYHARRVYNGAGDYVEGWLVGSLLQPRDLMRLSLGKRRKLLANYLDSVAELEVDFVGLGAYTSVISSAGVDVINDRFHTTTGNSLTAMVGVDALLSTCTNRGAPLAKRLTGVIGAYGSVGRLASLRLGRFCEHLVLLGNGANRGAMDELRLVAGELYRDALLQIQGGHSSGIAKSLVLLLPSLASVEQLLDRDLGDEEQLRELFDRIDALAQGKPQVQPPLVITADLGSWLPRLETVLSATSNGSAFIDPLVLHQNAIICDCAQPPDIGHVTLALRPDVTVIEGGLIHLPDRSQRFGQQNLTGLPTGVTFSCLAETMVLTMAGLQRDYSIGKRPPLEDAEAIFDLARAFGFAPAVEQLIEKAG